MRRSELVGLDVGDVVRTNDGLVVTIRRSKTDQEGAGRKIGIPYGSHPQTCPVRAVDAWKEAARHALETAAKKAVFKAENDGRNPVLYNKVGNDQKVPDAAGFGEPEPSAKVVGLSAATPLFRGVDRHGNVSAGRLSDQTVARVVKREVPGVTFLVPTTPATHDVVSNLARGFEGMEVKLGAFDEFVPQCDLCLAVSGTATALMTEPR